MFTNKCDYERTTKNAQRKIKSAQKRELCTGNWAAIRFVVYIIYVFQSIFKVGKADADRVTQFSGLPTLVHQQVRKLNETFGKENVDANVDSKLENVTTSDAKDIENNFLQTIFEETNEIPAGNQKSFKPKKK